MEEFTIGGREAEIAAGLGALPTTDVEQMEIQGMYQSSTSVTCSKALPKTLV